MTSAKCDSLSGVQMDPHVGEPGTIIFCSCSRTHSELTPRTITTGIVIKMPTLRFVCLLSIARRTPSSTALRNCFLKSCPLWSSIRKPPEHLTICLTIRGVA